MIKPRKPRLKTPVVSAKILPSAMTVAAICFGLSSVKFALDDRPTEAMAFLAIAAILDALDGRIARALNATSRMGEEIDSLADAVNFGVAPAFIVYGTLLSASWHTHKLRMWNPETLEEHALVCESVGPRSPNAIE